MQADLPDDPLVRETMAALGPGAKDATLDDLAAWIRQLEELCDSKDAALAPTSFRTDISGSCLSKFKASGTSTGRTKLQTKAVKGFAPLPELRMEKVSIKKKNARVEAKLRLSVERGPVLVLLTMTDLHGASRTLLAVTVDDNDLIPIKHPATTIEVTAVPFAPDQLLERLRIVEAKVKRQREHHARTSASPQPVVEEVSAQRQADGVEYSTKRYGSYILEKIVDREKGTVTYRSSGCPDPHCDDLNCTKASTTPPMVLKNGEMKISSDDPEMNDFVAPMLKNFQEHPERVVDLLRRREALLKEENAIRGKLPTAKPAQKKRMLNELEHKNAEYAKLTEHGLGRKGQLEGPEPRRRSCQTSHRRIRGVHRDQGETRHYLEPNEEEATVRAVGSQGNDFDASMNEIAAVADGREPGGSKELNGVSIRINGALIPS
ncbi:hypothetical protein AAVH_27559 [Aphelenchoides avenae]|nr:hypothetical protein AAVH_27559 [Aphelenchus avenae]